MYMKHRNRSKNQEKKLGADLVINSRATPTT